MNTITRRLAITLAATMLAALGITGVESTLASATTVTTCPVDLSWQFRTSSGATLRGGTIAVTTAASTVTYAFDAYAASKPYVIIVAKVSGRYATAALQMSTSTPVVGEPVTFTFTGSTCDSLRSTTGAYALASTTVVVSPAAPPVVPE